MYNATQNNISHMNINKTQNVFIHKILADRLQANE